MNNNELIQLWSNKDKRNSYIRDNNNYDLIDLTRDGSVKVERLNNTPFVKISLEVIHNPATLDMFDKPCYYQRLAYRKVDKTENGLLPFDINVNSIESWMKNHVQSLRKSIGGNN